MSEIDETSYELGSRSAWRRMLEQSLRELGRDSPEWTEKRWLLEREEAISCLRMLCAEFGDNDWTDDLHIADIIEKHLGRHLHDRIETLETACRAVVDTSHGAGAKHWAACELCRAALPEIKGR